MIELTRGSRRRTFRWRLSVKVIAVTVLASLTVAGCGSSGSASPAGSAASSPASGSASPTGSAMSSPASGSETPASAAASFPTEDVSLNLWWWGGDDAKGLKLWFDQAAAAYKAKHPNVTIVPVEQTSDGLLTAFAAAAEAKQGPDIQYFWGGVWGMENVWKGALSPISDYIPKDELSHYLNAIEDTYDGKVWTAPFQLAPSFPVWYRKDVFAKLNVKAPTSWAEMITACDAFHDAGNGYSLFAGGIKDGWFGGWLWTLIGQQQLANLGELMDAAAGTNGRTMADPAVAEYWNKLAEMQTHHCWNDDIGSVALYDGQQAWRDGKSGITVAGNVQEAMVTAGGGVDNIVIGTMPTWGTGPFAKVIGSSSQTLGVTSWSKYPQVGADFIRFLHEPEQMAAQSELSGTFVADDRFDPANLKSRIAADFFALAKVGGPYLENFIPTQLDTDGIIKHSQLVLTGHESVADAITAVQAVADRLKQTQPEQAANFATWAKSYK